MKIQLPIRKLLSLFSFLLVSIFSFAQQVPGTLTVDTGMPVTQMVQNLVGPGVQISNVVVTAADGSYGYYYINGTEIGDSEGILLSTGRAVNAIGPNDETGLPQLGPPPTFTCLNCGQYDNQAPGSELLNAAQDRNTFDACQIEFDIIPSGDSLRFRYTFASEEYNEWVGSPFNDVFGFFISGPNVGTDVNIALIPNTSTVVAINTVNANSNSQYWVNNMTPPGQGFQFDGFTIDLVAAVGDLIPCESYHMTLVIADASDRIYDSAVMINTIESNPVIVAAATAGGLDYMIEGCNDGTITFSRPEVGPNPQTVTYYIGGTATNGVDYTQLGNGIPGEPIQVVIPANQTSTSINIEAFADEVTEGSEYITIYLENPLCTAPEFVDSINFYIEDALTVDIQPDVANICAGQCVDIIVNTVTPSGSSQSWDPTDDISDPNGLNVTACPTNTTTYTFTNQVSDCVASDQITVNVSYISLGFDSQPINCANASTGSIDLTVLNANPPYTYAWTGPNGFTSDIEDPQNLPDGEYCVTVTDASGCVASGCVTVFEFNVLAITDVDILLNGCFPISCFGECDGAVNVQFTGGVAPYTFAWLDENNNVVANTQNVTGLCAGTYVFVLQDNAGCEVQNTVVIEQPQEIFVNLIGTVDVLCDGTSTGSITVDASGGCAPYFYVWAGFPANTSPVLSDIPSGDYGVSVTDNNGCASANSLSITVNDPINPLQVDVDEVSIYPGGFNTSCPTSNDGYINVTASLGTTPYTFEWVNESNGQVIGNTEDISGLGCGTYIFTATDANGCEVSQSFDIECPPVIQITSETVPNPCGNELAGLGEIHILTTIGGHGGPYTYSFTGPSCAPCTGTDLTGLNSGLYILTVTDALGCTRNFNINVGTETAFTVDAIVTDASCGTECDGSINITVNTLDPFTVVWRDEEGNIISNDEDLTGLCGGIYEAEVVSNGCQGFFSYTIIQPVPIVIDVVNVVDPSCFGVNNGSIDIEVSGGTGPYFYSWTAAGCVFTPSSSEDISNLFDCCYTVTVTDATGCSVSEEICLEAPQVMQLFVSTPSDATGGFDITCNGANDGSISVTVNGGTPDCIGFAPECYFFDWAQDVTQYGNPANASFISNLPAGSYAVNVTDANGCLATTTIDLTEPDPITANEIITDISCNGNTDGMIEINVTGGSGVYVNYMWEPEVELDENGNAINLDPGCYDLTVTDSFDCIATFTFCINEPDELQADIQAISPTPCAGVCDGSINVSPIGGTAPYDVVITDGINTYNSAFLIDLCDGVYTINVVDANGCTYNTEVTLESPDTYDVEITAPQINPSQIYTLNCLNDCDGVLQAVTTGGQEPFTYTWYDDQNNVVGNEAQATGLCAGVYSVQVVDGTGCIVTAFYDVTEPTEELIITSIVSVYQMGYNISCFGACDGAIDLTVTGGVPDYTFLWNDGNLLDPNEDQANLCAMFYNVLVTDANGCEQLLSFDLIEPAPLVVNETVSMFDGGANVSCHDACDGTIDLEILGGEPGYTVDWTTLSVTGTTLTNLCPGEYPYVVTDAIGCTYEGSITITAPLELTGTINATFDCLSGTNTLCVVANGGSGTYSYAWSTSEITDCIEVSDSNEYCVTITDSNGCETTVCITPTTPAPIVITPTSTNTTCGQCNGTISLDITGGSGGYTIVWTGVGVVQGAATQTDLCAGLYVAQVTDDSNCSETVEIIIEDSVQPTVNAAVSNVSCNGAGNGSIILDITNATGQITSGWVSNGEVISTDLSLSDIGPGVYTFGWSDEAGCLGTEQYTITEPEALSIEVDLSLYEEGFNVSDYGASDGAIDITVSGGTPDYVFDWGHIATSPEPEDIANLTAGDYLLTITDANGCTVDTLITLTEPNELKWPTGITPNNDNFNDVYVIQGIEKYRKNEFKVFNRWGNLVYEKSNYNQDWHGQNSDGEELPNGTYFVIFTSGKVSFNTYVDLRR